MKYNILFCVFEIHSIDPETNRCIHCNRFPKRKFDGPSMCSIHLKRDRYCAKCQTDNSSLPPHLRSSSSKTESFYKPKVVPRK